MADLITINPTDAEMGFVHKLIAFKQASEREILAVSDERRAHMAARDAHNNPNFRRSIASDDTRGLDGQTTPPAYAYGKLTPDGLSIADVHHKGPTEIHTHPFMETVQVMNGRGWAIEIITGPSPDGVVAVNEKEYESGDVFKNPPGGHQWHAFVPKDDTGKVNLTGHVNFVALTPASLSGDQTIEASSEVHPEVVNAYTGVIRRLAAGEPPLK